MNAFSVQNLSAFFAVLLSGLSAGLFYSYACSVNIGLGRLSDYEYLRAMQSINEAILNPIFFLSFMGSLILLPIVTWMNYGQAGFFLLLSGTLFYVMGVFGVTVVGNVPLNEGLAHFNMDGASAQQLLEQRTKFELPWNKYHSIRTIAAIISFALTALSIFKFK